MAQYQLTDEEVEIISSRVQYWHERAAKHREIIPVVSKGGFEGFEEIWYTVDRIPKPLESRDLKNVETAVAALAKDQANIVFHAYVLELDWPTVQAARAGKFDIQDISLQAAARQLALMEAYTVFQGATRPSISGLFGKAGSTSTASDAWDTAPNAVAVISDMMSKMPDYDPPFELCISSNARTGIKKFINATPTGPWLQEDGIKNLIGGGIYYYTITPASPNKKQIYPFPAASSNDAVALLLKSGPDVAELMIEQPVTTIAGEFDTFRGIYPILIFQALTVRVWDADAITKHVTIDFA